MVNTPQNTAAYFHQSRFQSMPMMIDRIKNTATNAPMIASARVSNVLTDAASVGTTTFSLSFSQSRGKAVAIGRTNVPIRSIKSKARSLGILCHRYACTKYVIPAIVMMTTPSARSSRDGENPSLVGAKAEGASVGLEGTAVSVPLNVSGVRLT